MRRTGAKHLRAIAHPICELSSDGNAREELDGEEEMFDEHHWGGFVFSERKEHQPA
jgi:hypothetical protein